MVQLEVISSEISVKDELLGRLLCAPRSGWQWKDSNYVLDGCSANALFFIMENKSASSLSELGR